MEELTPKIERYLLDEMSAEEKHAFDLEMEKDPDLKAEVELQQKTVALLQKGAEIELKEKVQALNNESKGQIVWLKPLTRVAAAIVILLIPTYFYVHSRYGDSNLYASYAAPYPDRITHMGEPTDVAIQNAMDLYNKGEYAASAPAFEALRKGDPANDQLALYEAVSLMNSDQAGKAITLLETQLSETVDNVPAFEWQLILAYLADERGDEALPLLERFLQHNDGYQRESAEALLGDLKSVWR